jgi:hypothetical protein
MLKKLKGFDDLIRWMMENGYEKTFRGENLGFMLKVSERNFPEINLLFKSVVKQVGINMPELYIYNDPVMNAYNLWRVVDKCPKCGSWLILPIEFSPRYWYHCLKQFFQSKKN